MPESRLARTRAAYEDERTGLSAEHVAWLAKIRAENAKREWMTLAVYRPDLAETKQ